MSNIDCPLCQRIDMVQKVTAIVEGETHQTSGYSSTTNTSNIAGQQNYYTRQNEHVGHGNLSGEIHSRSSTNISATQQSHLAQKLKAPTRPSPPTEPNFNASVTSSIPENAGMIMGGVIWFLASILLFAVFPDAGDNWIIGALIILIGAPILAGSVMGLAGIALDEGWSRMKFPTEAREKALAKYQSELQNYEQVRYPRWEEAMNRWMRMYYCRRCDVVYVPGDNVKPQNPDKALDLCYHKEKKKETQDEVLRHLVEEIMNLQDE